MQAKNRVRAYAVMLMLFSFNSVYSQIPAIQELGKEAGKVSDVRHISVGRFMLGMASTFADKEQRAVFKMLDNIEMIECRNGEYASCLSERMLQIIDDVGARYLASQDDGKALNKIYAVQNVNVVNELIILVYGYDKNFTVVAMSGEIPLERLQEISRIKP